MGTEAHQSPPVMPPVIDEVVEMAGEVAGPRRRDEFQSNPALWFGLAIAALVAIWVGLTALGKDHSVSQSAGSVPFPDRLAYVATSGLAGHPLRVYFRQGTGLDPASLEKGGSGARAGPYLKLIAGPEGDHDGVRFEWSPDGHRAWILDESGAMHVVPGALSVATGSVKTASFSPDGTRLAICSEERWPPRIEVIPLTDHDSRPRPSIEGCFPRWSADGVYVAYRVPSSGTGVYRAGQVEVLNTRLHVTFGVRAAWPVAWATWPGYTFAPLTVASLDGRAVLIMSPRGGAPRTLVSTEVLARIAGKPVGRIMAMAWSLEGDRLALGVDDGPGPGADGLVVVDPRSGEGTYLTMPRGPSSLSWNPLGTLLAELRLELDDHVTFVLPKTYEVTMLKGYRQASWSPDGRWILARRLTTWFAVDAEDPQRRVAFPDSNGWFRAAWCCPSVAVQQTGE